MQRMPNTSHQRWGEVWRQLFTEVYSRMCAVRNQLNVSSEHRTERLSGNSAMRPEYKGISVARTVYTLHLVGAR